MLADDLEHRCPIAGQVAAEAVPVAALLQERLRRHPARERRPPEPSEPVRVAANADSRIEAAHQLEDLAMGDEGARRPAEARETANGDGRRSWNVCVGLAH